MCRYPGYPVIAPSSYMGDGGAYCGYQESGPSRYLGIGFLGIQVEDHLMVVLLMEDHLEMVLMEEAYQIVEDCYVYMLIIG